MAAHGRVVALELMGTLLEMVNLIWAAVGRRRCTKAESVAGVGEVEEIDRLRAENKRLRSVLHDNCELLDALYKSSAIDQDCPPDVQEQLVAAVGSESFLKKIESLQLESQSCRTDGNFNELEVAIKVDNEEPSLWVLIAHDSIGSMQEDSQIDGENYVIVDEANVVDGVSDFIARCILEDPKSKNLTPQELQKAIKKTLGTINDKRKWKDIWEAAKILYTMATWGIAIAGLYKNRAILKLATKGLKTTANVVMKVL